MLLHPVLALSIVLVYPGAPGTPAEASSFLQTLGRYVEKRGGFAPASVNVTYENDRARGIEALSKASGFAVATLPSLCEAGELRYRYVCSPAVDGHAAETVSILKKAEAGDATAKASSDPLTLVPYRGRKLAGTIVTYRAYVESLVLGSKLSLARDFVAVRKPNALLALRALRDGEADLLILTQSQVDALAGVGQAGAVTEIFRTAPIPAAPVLALGTASAAEIDGVRKAFLGMCADPEGAELCDTMGVSSFASDQDALLADALRICWGSQSAAKP